VDVAREAKAGLVWTSAGKSVVQLVGFGVSLALARLLTPADFGLIGMVVVVSGFLGVFTELGFSAALIQRPEIEERHSNSVFWASLALGVFLALALCLSAPFLAAFYGEGRLLWMARVLALDFVFGAMGIVPGALLARQMRFDALARAEVLGSLASSLLGLALAFGGRGVWALVAMPLATSFVAAWVQLRASRFRPGFGFDRSALGELWGVSSHLFGYGILEYWARQVDDLLIGRVLGARALGLYSRAFSTMMMPVHEVGGVISRVMFPAFSRLAGDVERIRKEYLRLLAVIAFVTFPVLFSLSVLAEPFILVLYGPTWVGAKTVLSIYCIAGASQAVGSTVGFVYMALGRTDQLLRWGLLAALVIISAIGVGIAFGSIEAVALSYTIATAGVLSGPRFAWLGRLIGLRLADVFRALRGALAASLASMGVVVLLGRLTSAFSPAADFALRSGVALALYLALALGFSIRGYTELRATIRERLEPTP